MANVIGTKWGPNKIGTKGGVVTWSIAGAGESTNNFDAGGGRSVNGSSFLNFDFRQVISDAFAAWSSYGNIEFMQVADPGGAAGASAASDIRIFFGPIPGRVIGYAFFPTRDDSAIAGDILLDTLTSFNSNRADFRALVLHEIGHALGLGHVAANSVLTPVLSATSLQQDDIRGIRQIYGRQDNADPVYNIKGGGTVRILESPANLTIKGNSRDNRVIGASDDDSINGAQGDDTLRGGDGADSLNGSSGNDDLSGGAGADVLKGGIGRDKLAGGAGADVLNGGRDKDTADYSSSLAAIAFDLAVSSTGTAGDALGDTLINIEKILGGAGNDTLLGSNGVDRFAGGDGADFLSGRDGNDNLAGGNGTDTLDGGAGNDNLVGGSGADLLQGMAGKDVLKGDAGNDTLEGGDGNDTLDGGHDQDVLNGGAGNDALTGGRSADTFVFVDGHGNDRITDFKPSSTVEFIDLSGVTVLNSFGDVVAASSNTAKGVLIDTGGGDSILVKGIRLNVLEVDDFLF
ncbi:matrixin family metalloprotease [Roseovarius aestuarii]|uniref:Bifunctional hemolysin/adenylate cyclase n=1 Tax=Roseovarius aestuarii TaxID=475083 RepID=A0A1X7BLW0_9RHOB|nr:matrixin family metalloprotease [Roseovarius aestuarii]SMC10239.1 Bifunctional hemolysin/adenylate cyclase precursor [Roseovarius aestuarii]